MENAELKNALAEIERLKRLLTIEQKKSAFYGKIVDEYLAEKRKQRGQR